MPKLITDQTIINKIRKPKTRKGKRILEKREPQLIEDVKKSLLCRCSTANNNCMQLLKDLYQLKKPNAILFNRKESWKLFDENGPNNNGIAQLEFLAKKNDCSLFGYVSHSKKRPNNLILGRTYDGQILDMIEFGFENFLPLSSFKKSKITLGSKPLLLFCGEKFNSDPEYQRIKSLLMDFFLGPMNINNQINLQGLEHVLNFIEIDGKIFLRSYRIVLKKSGIRLPRVELEEIGPRIDLNLRRLRLSSEDLFRKTLKQSDKQLQQYQQSQQQGLKRKHPSSSDDKKNIDFDAFGTKLGRIHMESQDYSRLKLRKAGAFKIRVTDKPEQEDQE